MMLPGTRRGFLQLSATAWFAGLAQAAAESPPARRKACILLWMDGGPSHIDTFDPKPDAAAEVRGSLSAIASAVPGIHVGEKFPQVAERMRHIALVRGMSTDLADHIQARVLTHTSYRPTAGGPQHPILGSTVSAEIGDPALNIPSFVACGTPRMAGGSTYLDESGYLGPRHTPLIVPDSRAGVANLRPRVAQDDFDARVQVLDEFNDAFVRERAASAALAHRTNLQRAVAMMTADERLAFDLASEPEASASRYGASDFGRSCLLARRLVEAGVSFVEVYSRDWDNHNGAASNILANETMPAVDQGMSALLDDLHSRGLLEHTLVIWMGEFGRTPRINASGGRDHYSTAWSLALAGGGVQAGRTVGRTSADGSAISDRRVTIVDFFATVYTLLGIDYRKDRTIPGGRKVPIVDLQTQEEPNLLRELL